MSYKDHPSPMAENGRPCRNSEGRDANTLERIDLEIDAEEEELDRVYSLGFSGYEFDQYVDGLQRRIDELYSTRRHVLRILSNPTRMTNEPREDQ